MDETSIASNYAVQELFKVASLDSSGEEESSMIEKIADPSTDGSELSFEDREMLRNALGQLKDAEREVMERFFFQSLSQTELADAQGISVNYVSHLLRTGTEKLRKVIMTQDLIESQMRIRELQKRVDTYEQAVEEYTVVDIQTQIYNKRYFGERLDEEVSRAARYTAQLSVLVLDVTPTGKKGLQEGGRFSDDVVRAIAATIKGNIRKVDIPARLDHARFAVILPHTGETANIVQERLETLLCDVRVPGKHRLAVRSGYGIFPNDGRTKDDLLGRAIEQMEKNGTLKKAA